MRCWSVTHVSYVPTVSAGPLLWNRRIVVRIAKRSALVGLQVLQETQPLKWNVQHIFWFRSVPRLLPGPLGSDPVEAELQKLISEYCAIEKMDRIVRSATQRGQTELIGLRVRELRRREILLELTKWIIVAKTC